MHLQRQWVRIGFVWETFYISAAPSSSSCFSVFWNKWNHLKEPPCNIFQPGTSCGSHLAKTARLQRSSRLSGLPPPFYLRLSPSRWRAVIFWKYIFTKYIFEKNHVAKYTWQKNFCSIYFCKILICLRTTWGGVHLDEGRIPFQARGVRNGPLNPADVRIVCGGPVNNCIANKPCLSANNNGWQSGRQFVPLLLFCSSARGAGYPSPSPSTIQVSIKGKISPFSLWTVSLCMVFGLFWTMVMGLMMTMGWRWGR